MTAHITLTPNLTLSCRTSRRLLQITKLATQHAGYTIFDNHTKWSVKCTASSDGTATIEVYPPPLTTRAGRRVASRIPKHTHP